MNDFSLIQKIDILMNVIFSSPFFITLFVMMILLLLLNIISSITKKKINKYIYIVLWSILFVIIIVTNNKVILELINNLYDYFFDALYFPNIYMYMFYFITFNIILFYATFSKKILKSYKIINIICSNTFNILFVFIISIINSNNIDISSLVSIYSNSNLMVLIQLSSSIYFSWILLNLLITVYIKLKKFDKNVPEIIFD